MKSRYEGIQNKLWGIKEGCFFLTLLSIAEDYRQDNNWDNWKIDFVDILNKSFEKKWITDDYTVKKDKEILKELTGKEVTRRECKTCGNLKSNEYSAMKYLNKEKTANHFRRRYFDVYLNSRTVSEGTLVCYYIYTIG